ncbi:MAG TPA: DMT family transporter [Actinophytocola sp.]|uniref:DMT family transporter n=1 Tax=Actinophytocola sp. TaxID=1872138 RepID=UPI002DDD8D7B|nr:DMT family transporter [Actinophytocola sp.]HEV2779553.1 DMT family transporter [Actinophytocola sp.]
MTDLVARAPRAGIAIGSGALAATIVGGSVPVVGLLDAYPMLSGQAIRYLLGGLLLVAWAGVGRRRLPRPGARDLLSLLGLAATGMLGFNACLLYAQRYAEPGFVAAVLGGTPLVLALLAPLLAGRPALLTMVGALAVVAGIVVLSGGGSWHGPGLLLALLTLACEASFTLLAIGVVARLGAFAVSTWCCLLAAALGSVLATAIDGAAAWQLPTAREAAALLLLAALTTALGFCLWYRAVSDLGADRAGVLIGLMPVSGLAVSIALGAQPLTLVSCAGIVLVTAGCVLGLHRHRPTLSTPTSPIHTPPKVDLPTAIPG